MKIAVCASGPSLTTEDCATVRGHCDSVIAVNDTHRITDCDHVYAADYKWWKMHHASVSEKPKRWSCETQSKSNWKNRDNEKWGVTLLDHVLNPGLSRNPSAVHGGGNSGYQAINLALNLGASRIILLGFDMGWTGGKAHWFGNHPAGLSNQKPDRYIAAFRTIKPEEYNIEILNCSRETALDAFPRCDLMDTLTR